MGTLMDVLVPDIGDAADVAVIEILVAVGERIDAGQPLLVLEGDKATLEVPAPRDGRLAGIKVATGDKVSRGSVIAVLDIDVGMDAGSARPASTTSASPTPREAPISLAPSKPSSTASSAPTITPAATGRLPYASPTIRQLARELGVPMDQVAGTGPRQRIMREDVLRFAKHALAQRATTTTQASAHNTPLPGLLAWPTVDFAKFGPVESQPLTRIKKLSGANLHRNWLSIPHVTNHEEADVTDLEALRVRLNEEHASTGSKITLLAFLMKAAAATLLRFPAFNASLDGDQIVLKRYVHIGFAADTPQGLVVPVIRDVDRKGLLAISTEMAALAAKARDGKLSPVDMSGGCFSISSLGGIGGTEFTPIINAPEVAILGVGKSRVQPRWDGAAFQPRLILPMSLSWDHRAVDGAAAGRFNAHLAALLADFRRLTL
ncbi:dihydrolipoamide acetyltransferase [Pseudoxanthomonas jiangsuensis]|uniref:dihydrolipoyllysine-residue acetyltransferase n=1 Tax=Pseudoxanthomonas jiangsuensis TaxID=619688 RepID=UPI001391C2B1|nr:dihydrolipoyllysine-residue acetyltransferase [Pseudoxanthomonas jiangsuensis]KAF1697275.1 dihydrolipoamide acetyltransferase [Pseudoxanthomonas jiangsuensis]